MPPYVKNGERHADKQLAAQLKPLTLQELPGARTKGEQPQRTGGSSAATGPCLRTHANLRTRTHTPPPLSPPQPHTPHALRRRPAGRLQPGAKRALRLQRTTPPGACPPRPPRAPLPQGRRRGPRQTAQLGGGPAVPGPAGGALRHSAGAEGKARGGGHLGGASAAARRADPGPPPSPSRAPGKRRRRPCRGRPPLPGAGRAAEAPRPSPPLQGLPSAWASTAAASGLSAAPRSLLR